MSEEPITLAFDPDRKLIATAFETTDDVGKILRCHLVIEQQIEKLIKTLSKAKVDRRTNFWSKINLMRAIRVPECVCFSCEAINDLRNQFAHNSKATIANTKTLSDAYLISVESFIKILPKAHGEVIRKGEGVVYTYTYAQADQGEKIVIASSWLSSVLGALPKLYDFDSLPSIAKVRNLDL